MSTQLNNSARATSSFGGCTRLSSQYRTIGIGLLRYERSYSSIALTHRRLESAATVFRQHVSPIPVEVLESYLDDVLDLSVTLEHLFLRRGARQLLTAVNLMLGSAALVGLGVCIAWSRSFPLLSSLICSPLLVCGGFFVMSRNHLVRRLRFAHLLRDEVAYRRGGRSGQSRLQIVPRVALG